MRSSALDVAQRTLVEMERRPIVRWIAKAAREMRLEAGRSLADIASAHGVDQSTVARFESGRGQRPDLELPGTYARVCGHREVDLWRRAVDLWDESEQS